MEQNLEIVLLLTKYAMYATAIATWALRFLIPSPEEFTSIFGLTVAPHRYLVIYNVLRWIAGNKSWVMGGESKRTLTQETTNLAGDKTVSSLTTEKTMNQDAKVEPEKKDE